jgi:glycosyltransferase involved in cell wall biosynthesis
MKLIMTLLVKDEEDIIRENIEYHLSQGVDYFIAIDNASIDKTSDILKEYEAKGVLTYLIEKRNFDQSNWVTRMARMAHLRFSADWVINNDADEFWWPTTGNLKAALENVPLSYSLVRAKRHNMLALETNTDVPFYKKYVYRRLVSLNPVGRKLPSKVCHRGLPNIKIPAGSHKASANYDLKTIRGVLEIFHFPIRNFKQLKSKTINIGTAYEKDPNIDLSISSGPGNAQRKIFQDYRNDPQSLMRYYKKNRLGKIELIWNLMIGRIVKDTRISEYFSVAMGL